MTIEFWFWIIYVIALIFALYSEYTPGTPYPFPRGFRNVIFFILIGLLGLRVFGSPIK